ncbi:MAG: VOC family protein [Pseudomonadota bacterium]
MPIRIDHVGIACTDVARSLEFYSRLLAGTAEQRAGHLVITAGALRLALVPRETAATRTDRGQHLALRTSLEERPLLLERLRELGAPWEDVRGRLYTQDPDGFVLEFLFD